MRPWSSVSVICSSRTNRLRYQVRDLNLDPLPGNVSRTNPDLIERIGLILMKGNNGSVQNVLHSAVVVLPFDCITTQLLHCTRSYKIVAPLHRPNGLSRAKRTLFTRQTEWSAASSLCSRKKQAHGTTATRRWNERGYYIWCLDGARKGLIL